MINRNYKDTLFCTIFHQKKDLLSLYNALNHSNYADEDSITITTLDGALYLGYHNDLSFLIQDTLLLYEHQSSLNPNMPLRGLLYFAKLYEDYIAEHKYNIYGSVLLPLPIPKFFVFYNGTVEMPDRWVGNLSDAFTNTKNDTDWSLDCSAEYLNINFGHNKALMEACHTLWEYSYFIQAIRIHLHEGHTFENSVENAMDECIKKDILKDILERNRDLMIDLLKEYDLDFHIKSEKQLSYEEGVNAGRAEGLAEGRTAGVREKLIENIKKKLQKGQSADVIADALEEDIETITAIINKLNA